MPKVNILQGRLRKILQPTSKKDVSWSDVKDNLRNFEGVEDNNKSTIEAKQSSIMMPKRLDHISREWFYY